MAIAKPMKPLRFRRPWFRRLSLRRLRIQNGGGIFFNAHQCVFGISTLGPDKLGPGEFVHETFEHFAGLD